MRIVLLIKLILSGQLKCAVVQQVSINNSTWKAYSTSPIIIRMIKSNLRKEPLSEENLQESHINCISVSLWEGWKSSNKSKYLDLLNIGQQATDMYNIFKQRWLGVPGWLSR